MTIVYIVLAVIVIVVILNMKEKRAGAATLNPETAKNLYESNPKLKEPFLELASGNIDALQLLERLGTLSLKYKHIDLDKFLRLNITGYKITLLYRAVGKDIMKLGLATANNSEITKLLQHIEAIKYDTLPEYNKMTSQMILKEHEIENTEELMQISNVVAWKSVLNWKLLWELRGSKVDGIECVVIDIDLIPNRNNHKIVADFDHILFDFLIPDQIDCSTWLINYFAIADFGDAISLSDFISPIVKELSEEYSMGEQPAYPVWYKAAYPEVVKWLGSSNAIDELGQELHDLVEDDLEQSVFEQRLDGQPVMGITLSYHILRLLHTAYKAKFIK